MKISNFEEISSFLSDNKFKKCFLITGSNSYYKSGADKIFDKILEKKILVKYFKKNSIPEFDELKKIIALIEELPRSSNSYWRRSSNRLCKVR